MCVCDCGGAAIAVGQKLRSGTHISCGCIARENARRLSTEATAVAGGLDYKARARARVIAWNESIREAAQKAKASGEVSTVSEFYYRRNIERKYGCTPEMLDSLMSKQQGACAICHLPPENGRRLCIDHDHATGAIRGLLCNGCNSGLGNFGDDIMRMARAMKYLSDNSQ